MRRGDVRWINVAPTIGSKIRKTRPAVLVSDDAVGARPLRVIVPVTDWKERYSVAPWMLKLTPDRRNGLDKVAAADSFRVRSVAVQRRRGKPVQPPPA